jgi:hypothetical protein
MLTGTLVVKTSAEKLSTGAPSELMLPSSSRNGWYTGAMRATGSVEYRKNICKGACVNKTEERSPPTYVNDFAKAAKHELAVHLHEWYCVL